ncbi:Rieske (2Fe-2S) protein [Streptomyces sp. NBC_01537]|uniref:Rieske (2Fe-2S) protein n=1 Tax=Streptomyces sp. NBC_01537 TaxID=2903896 RepID=UPI0038688C48
MTTLPPCRRTVLQGAALAGVAGIGLTACGSSDSDSATTTAETSAAATSTELGATSDVPVGGAKLYKDAKLVVSQPTKGTYKAFSAVCTHQGCVCDSVTGTSLLCACHGSKFNAETGAVEQGPATTALRAATVTVKEGKLVAG